MAVLSPMGPQPTTTMLTFEACGLIVTKRTNIHVVFIFVGIKPYGFEDNFLMIIYFSPIVFSFSVISFFIFKIFMVHPGTSLMVEVLYILSVLCMSLHP